MFPTINREPDAERLWKTFRSLGWAEGDWERTLHNSNRDLARGETLEEVTAGWPDWLRSVAAIRGHDR